MQSIMHLIDAAEEKIGHSLHPAIVAVPLGAWAVSAVSDLLGAATRQTRFDDSARISMAVGLAGAAGAVVTGLHDYSYIPRDRPSHPVATRHAIGNAVVSALFATSYILRTRRYLQGRRPGLLARSTCLAGGALSVYTGWLGGKLVEEYGEAVKPVMKQMDEQRDTLNIARQSRSKSPSQTTANPI